MFLNKLYIQVDFITFLKYLWYNFTWTSSFQLMLQHFLFLVNNFNSHLSKLTTFQFVVYLWCITRFIMLNICFVINFICVCNFRSCFRIPTSFTFQYLYYLNPSLNRWCASATSSKSTFYIFMPEELVELGHPITLQNLNLNTHLFIFIIFPLNVALADRGEYIKKSVLWRDC